MRQNSGLREVEISEVTLLFIIRVLELKPEILCFYYAES